MKLKFHKIKNKASSLWHDACKVICQPGKPQVRKKIDMTYEIYADERSDKPMFTATLDGEWDYKLFCALRIAACVLFVLWILKKLSKLF